ncbi:M48 family metalloprotease [Methylocella sp.]|uniref:M48 family metalloprotease n=1 Tax=Methylocella sp. TaxID=1978226 RepID=UPI0037843F82
MTSSSAAARPGPARRDATGRRARACAAKGALALALVFALSACASIEPQIERQARIETPPPPPRPPAAEPRVSPAHARMAALFDGEYKDPAAERFLNDVLAKLAKADDRPSEPYKVTILNSPIVNAFALPPRDLFVTRGLLALANDASEAAAVMAHEISHLTARHAARREEEEKRAAVISQAASVVQDKKTSEAVEATARRTIASFSRQQELEADQLGVRTIARAGYDPYGAARFLTALGRSASMRGALIGQNASAERPDILSTHPATPERASLARAAARQIGAPGVGTRDRAAYLAAIDGVAFGDPASEGVVRGRKFVHARLGLVFVAPEGFALENAAKALLGVSASGDEALRLDSAKVAPDVTLEAYMASDWMEGVDKATIEPIDLNGFPAAIASAKAGEWSFRLAVVRFEKSEVYRLIFAFRKPGPDAERLFREALSSFRKASPEDLRALRPLRLLVVAAQPADTVATLAARMATSEPKEELFRLINGLDETEKLEPGERYKIVVEAP